MKNTLALLQKFVCLVFCFVFFPFSKLCRVVYRKRKAGERKKERMKEMLTKVVENYIQFNMFPRDDVMLASRYFLDYLRKTYKVLLVAFGVVSVIIVLDCPTSDSLGLLWRHCGSTRLGKVAEGYLVGDGIKKKLNLETVCLKTTIEYGNYRNCMEALMKHPGASSGEYKQNA